MQSCVKDRILIRIWTRKRCHYLEVWYFLNNFAATMWNICRNLTITASFVRELTLAWPNWLLLNDWILLVILVFIIPPTQRSCWGVYWFHSVRPSVCPSVRPASRVLSVASTVQYGFFPYLVQMINSMRGCVACDDPWPWPISSRSFGLDLENRVRSVASTVMDGFFLYLAQMITIIRGCVACYVDSSI